MSWWWILIAVIAYILVAAWFWDDNTYRDGGE